MAAAKILDSPIFTSSGGTGSQLRRAYPRGTLFRPMRGVGLAVGEPGGDVWQLDGTPRLAQRRHHRGLYVARGRRILAWPGGATGVAPAGDLHDVRARRPFSAAHAPVRLAAVVADQSG